MANTKGIYSVVEVRVRAPTCVVSRRRFPLASPWRPCDYLGINLYLISTCIAWRSFHPANIPKDSGPKNPLLIFLYYPLFNLVLKANSSLLQWFISLQNIFPKTFLRQQCGEYLKMARICIHNTRIQSSHKKNFPDICAPIEDLFFFSFLLIIILQKSKLDIFSV